MQMLIVQSTLSLFLGFTAIGFIIHHYVKSRETVSGFFIIFSITATVKTLINSIAIYVWVNLTSSAINIYLIFFYFVTSLIVSLTLMYISPLFFHNILDVSYKKAGNLVVLILSMLNLAIISVPYLILFLRPGEPSNLSGEYPFSLVMAAVLIYMITVCIFFIKEIVRKKLLIYSFQIIIIYLLFGMFDKMLIRDMIFVKNYPAAIGIFILFYSVWNLSILFYAFIGMKTISPQNSLSLEINAELPDKYGISEREMEIIRELLSGKTNKDIGKNLFISLKTVKNHVYNIYKKTGAGNRVELIRLLSRK